ncbi:MAG: hypothetical protein JSW02_06365 [candidate division WOR-3 bacterium]|nr:MAG: hypothetical protein JSW02_06365 [candidate division WOR-3 bacterium]
MADILEMTSSDISPARDDILENLGIPSGQELSSTVEELITEALGLFDRTCSPRAIYAPVTVSEFSGIYHGEGLNDQKTPLGDMYEQAREIVLFALTIGKEITEKISGLFLDDNLALAGVLDATASAGAETAADRVEAHYWDREISAELKKNAPDIYRFAPGYCGWHITGQKKLFRFLDPGKIGITLLPSYMMSPLKSLSGAIIVTEKSSTFGNAYNVCKQCVTHWCRTRKKIFQEYGG